MENTPAQAVSEKPGEFVASGGSPPGVSPATELIEAELAEIIAEALVADLRQFPDLKAVRTLPAPTAKSPRGSDRTGARLDQPANSTASNRR